ncbi:MAG: response regulator transcription factor [Synoicihabitans sp.]
MRVLVVEDYKPTRDSLEAGLRQENHAVESSASGRDALTMALQNDYEAIVLDVMLPDLDGWQVLRLLRESGSEAHILMLTAKAELEDKVQGFDFGADDYLTKPFAMDELKARLRAAGRSRFKQKDPVLRLDCGLVIDTGTRQVELSGEALKLTPKEYFLLHYMAMRRGELVTRTDIWENVYDYYSSGTSNVVDVYILRLRKKLEKAGGGGLIQTHRGHGYILEPRDV